MSNPHRSMKEWWDNPELPTKMEHWSFDPKARNRHRRVRRQVKRAVDLATERLLLEML
jgi:hypothetical protein